MTQKTDYRWSGAARARRLGRSAARHTLRPVIKRSTREWAAWMGPAWKGEGLLGDEERVVRMPMHRITHYYADVTGAIVRGYLIVGGPWDYLTYPMEDATWLYACRHTRTVYQIFDAGLRPEETSEYRKQVWKLRLGKSGRKKLKTRRALDAYFDDMRRTYHRMREQGYFSQAELGGSPKKDVRVAISRDGTVVRLGNGRHRYAMARLLELPEIAVYVRHVHPLWVRDCMRHFDTDAASAIRQGLAELQK